MLNNNSFKILLSLLITLLLAFGFFIYKLNCEKSADKFYLQGMELYNSSKYQDAYYNFSQIKRNSSLYSLALLKQFQCADNLSDKKTARAKLDILSKKIKDENIRPYILYSELVYNLDTNKYSNAQLNSKFLYIQKTYPDSDFAKASSYRIAKLQTDKNPAQSKDKFVEYLEYAPNGKFALDALDEISKLNVYLEKKDKEIIAKAYLKNLKYKEALEALKECDFQNNWIYIARAQRGLGDYESEKRTILKGLEEKQSNIDEKEISILIDRLVSLSSENKKQILMILNQKYQNTYADATISYKLASNSKTLMAVKLYEYIVKKYPDSYWASNSLWEIFWFNYSQKRYNSAYSIAQNYISKYPNSDDMARIKYWRAKILLKQRKNSLAKDAFYEIINSHPLSYYSFLSSRQLKISKAGKIFVKKQIQKYNIDNINKQLFGENKLLLTLLKYEDFQTIEELKINNELIKSWLLNKKQIYPESIRTAKDAVSENAGFSSYELKLMYPIVWEKLINQYSNLNNISSYLFMSLIREESHFSENAKSSAGALGLCQLMPSTADYIEKRKVSKEELLNAQENIRIGAKYFAYLINHFKGNIYLAILSYNAGHGNISKWLENPEITANEIDEFVENVPFLETKTYIKKILSTYWVYLNIY